MYFILNTLRGENFGRDSGGCCAGAARPCPGLSTASALLPAEKPLKTQRCRTPPLPLPGAKLTWRCGVVGQFMKQVWVPKVTFRVLRCLSTQGKGYDGEPRLLGMGFH